MDFLLLPSLEVASMETALPRCHLCQTQDRVAESHPFLFDLVPKTCLLCRTTVLQRRECIRILSSGGRLKDQPDPWVGPPLAETHGPDISGRQHRVGEPAPHWDDPHESICAICAKNASAGSYVKCGQCPLVWHHDCLQRASIAYAGDFASCPFCTGRHSLDLKDAGRMRGDPGYSVAKHWRVNQAKGKGRAPLQPFLSHPPLVRFLLLLRTHCHRCRSGRLRRTSLLHRRPRLPCRTSMLPGLPPWLPPPLLPGSRRLSRPSPLRSTRIGNRRLLLPSTNSSRRSGPSYPVRATPV